MSLKKKVKNTIKTIKIQNQNEIKTQNVSIFKYFHSIEFSSYSLILPTEIKNQILLF